MRERGLWEAIAQILLEWIATRIKPFFDEEDLFLRILSNNCNHRVCEAKLWNGKCRFSPYLDLAFDELIGEAVKSRRMDAQIRQLHSTDSFSSSSSTLPFNRTMVVLPSPLPSYTCSTQTFPSVNGLVTRRSHRLPYAPSKLTSMTAIPGRGTWMTSP